MADYLYIYDDTTYTVLWPLYEDDEGTVPMDVTGWSATSQIRDPNTLELLATFDVQLSTGLISLKLPAATRAWREAEFDVLFVAPNLDKSRPISGWVYNQRTVTRLP